MQTDKNTLHIITTFQGNSKIEGYWKEAFHDNIFTEKWNVNVIDGQFIEHESKFWADSYFKFAQNKFVFDLFSKNKVKNGDIFIFTEAMNYLLVPMSFIRYEFNLDVKFVGFWGNSVFGYRKTTSRWGKEFYYSTFNAYDLNLFQTFKHERLFNWRFKGFRSRRSPSAIVGYPFGYLYERFKPEIEKENIVVFPWEIKDEIQTRLFKGFHADFPGWDFVFAQKDFNQRDHYVKLLDRSKAMFWGGDRIDDPVVIFEGMSKGVIPFLPERTFYYHDFPSKYQYYKNLFEGRLSTNPGLLVVRRRFQLLDFMKEKFDNYEEWKETARLDAKVMKEEYYNTELFKEKLCQLT